MVKLLSDSDIMMFSFTELAGFFERGLMRITDEQFKIALISKKYKADRRKLLYREMVLGESRKDLTKESGVPESWFSKNVKSMLRNYTVQTEKYRLQSVTVVVTAETGEAIKLLEKRDLKTQLPKGVLPHFEYTGKSKSDKT